MTSVQRTRHRRGQRPQLAVLDSGVVDEVEADLEMDVDDLGCNEEDEENQPFINEDDATGEKDDTVNDDWDVEKETIAYPNL